MLGVVIWALPLLLILLSACGTPRSETTQTVSPASTPLGFHTVADLRAPHERVDNTVRNEDTVVLISFFNGGQMDVAQHASITGERSLRHTRLVQNWAMQGGASPIPAEKFESIYAKLTALPETDAHKRDGNAFFVSWQNDGKWITRNYDLTRLPPGVQQLLPDMGIPDTWLSSSAPESEK